LNQESVCSEEFKTGLNREALQMTLADWLPPLVIGITFTGIGAAKLIGLRVGVVGGKDKPFADRLCGT